VEEARVVTRYRLLVVSVASVAVLAVAVGALLATQVSPSPQDATAAPLGAPAPTPGAVPLSTGATPPTPGATPRSTGATPTPGATPPPSVTPTAVNAAKLPTGAAPQLTYVRARTVHSAVGGPITVPGSAEIVAAARLWDTTFTLQRQPDHSTALIVLDADARQVNRIPAVDSLASSIDGQSAAYAAGNLTEWRPGGKLWFQGPGSRPTATLSRKDGYGLEVLRVAGRQVYFRSAATAEAQPSLYRWDVDGAVHLLGKAVHPTAVSPDGSQSANLAVRTDSGSCTALTDTTTGRQHWRTCERQVIGFSPTGAYAIAIPPGDFPFGPEQIYPLDAATGKALRSWTAPAFQDLRAEDDDHLLLAWHDRASPGSRSTLVRCAISTGRCERTLPLSTEPLLLGS
jgi:hypothetical protein